MQIEKPSLNLSGPFWLQGWDELAQRWVRQLQSFPTAQAAEEMARRSGAYTRWRIVKARCCG